MPISHVGIATTQLATLSKFYDAALAPLGYKATLNFGSVIGYDGGQGPDFWIHEVSDPQKASGLVHIAFKSESQDKVKAFYAAAIAAGAKDNGPPGPRPQYGETYYAAFVLDPEGRNVEAHTF